MDNESRVMEAVAVLIQKDYLPKNM
ncbi:unnamed protein product, partial [Brachionus calyciflorus]